MILRQSKGIPKHYLFNAAGGAFLLVTAALAIRGAFYRAEIEPCLERYQLAMVFAWQRPSGEVLSAADLQARLAGRDWGINENVDIVKAKDAPSPSVLQVAVRAEAEGGAGQGRSGMGFVWTPSNIKEAEAACLAYSVLLPASFEYGTGGNLPGLLGSPAAGPDADAAAEEDKPAFATNVRWRGDGGMELAVSIPPEPRAGTVFHIDPSGLKLARGQWVRIEQEIVLNTTEEGDGVARVWVDGKLMLERNDLIFRKSLKPKIQGLTADVHHTKEGRTGFVPAAAPKDSRLQLSTFEIRWR